MRRLLGTIIAVACLAATAYAQDDAAVDNQCTIIAKTADGYYIAYCGFDYYPDDESPDEFKATYGWNIFSSGEPLNLELGGPLSFDDYDPLKPVSCGEGVDPAAVAALTGSSMYLRYGFSTKCCPDPAHPSGEFFSTVLPGGGTAVLRLPTGTAPHEVYTEWRGERYPMKRMEIIDAARLMARGETDPGQPEGGLETAVARTDVATVLAAAGSDDEQLAACLLEAAGVIQRCIEKYHERHGEYPAALADLTTIPGAVVARLPYNPYDCASQLGLEDASSGLDHTVRYFPEETTATDGTAAVTGYWLAVIGTGTPAAPLIEIPGDEADAANAVAWLEVHPENKL